MKSLKFADLKGAKTAVNCRTQEEWDKVTAICGYEWVDLLRWGEYRENSCISLNGLGYADTEFYRYTYRYTIIPASDFIAANTEATPDLSGTRPAIEWLPMLPEPYNKLALEAVKVAPDMPNEICEYKDCIMLAICWAKTKDSDFFDELDCHLKDSSHPLPPINPEWLEQAEQPKEESEYPQTKQLGPTIVEVLVSVQGQLSALSDKIESLEKQLSEIEANPIKPEPTQPEPKGVVLPVTVEEVWESEKLIKGKESFWCMTAGRIEKSRFNHVKLITEFRHESTTKKAIAYLTLLKIAEAQNEIVPRGDRQFYARYNISNQGIELMAIATPTAEYSYGLILFNSEQGLYDCIEANKELWMDLLRG